MTDHVGYLLHPWRYAMSMQFQAVPRDRERLNLSMASTRSAHLWPQAGSSSSRPGAAQSCAALWRIAQIRQHRRPNHASGQLRLRCRAGCAALWPKLKQPSRCTSTRHVRRAAGQLAAAGTVIVTVAVRADGAPRHACTTLRPWFPMTRDIR
jgi:hypothetical protein